MLFWIRLPKFVQIGAPTAEIWRHIHFWIWRPRPLNTTFGFVFFWCHCLQKVKVYQQTKFCPDICIGSWDITISGFEIQTSAILEFYFRFRSRPVRCNLHVILDQAAEIRPNRRTHCGNMTSYSFLKMAAATAKYYFRFRICWCHCLQKVKVYQQTKFCRYISIGGWDITTFVFEIQTSAILEFHFRFRSCHSASGCRFSSKSEHPALKYDVISIFKMAAVSHVVFTLGNGGPPFRGLNSDLKSLLRRINSSGDIAM